MLRREEIIIVLHDMDENGVFSFILGVNTYSGGSYVKKSSCS